MYRHEEPRSSFVSNIIAIAGFIILIVVVIWGLIHLASLSRGFLASLFGGSSRDVITLSAPATIASGQNFTLSWKYNPVQKGTYAFLYQCDANVQMRTHTGDGGLVIPCGAAYTVGQSASLALMPVLKNNATSSVSLTVIFLPSATSTGTSTSSTQAQGSTAISITPAPAPVMPTPTITTIQTTPTTPAPSTPSTPTPTRKSPADLTIKITSATVDAYGNGTVTFDIANDGGSGTGSYIFTAELPTTDAYTYTSTRQASLAPGARIVNTLNFSSVSPMGGTVLISVGNVTAAQQIAPTQYNPGYQNYNAGYPNYNQMYPTYQPTYYPQ